MSMSISISIQTFRVLSMPLYYTKIACGSYAPDRPLATKRFLSLPPSLSLSLCLFLSLSLPLSSSLSLSSLPPPPRYTHTHTHTQQGVRQWWAYACACVLDEVRGGRNAKNLKVLCFFWWFVFFWCLFFCVRRGKVPKTRRLAHYLPAWLRACMLACIQIAFCVFFFFCGALLACKHACFACIHTCMCLCMLAHVHDTYIHLHTCMHGYVHACIHTYIHVNVCVHVCVCVCMCAFVNVCV